MSGFESVQGAGIGAMGSCEEQMDGEISQRKCGMVEKEKSQRRSDACGRDQVYGVFLGLFKFYGL